MTYKPLFQLKRNGVIERVVHGVVATAFLGDETFIGTAETDILLRSLLKPWQLIASGALDEKAGLSDRVIMGLSSHSGEQQHITTLNELAAELGLTPRDLVLLKPSYPLDANEMFRLKAAQMPSCQLYHPCSGKHLLHRWAAQSSTYGDINSNNSAHQRLCHMIASKGIKPRFVLDSCGLPSLILSLSHLLRVWSSLEVAPDPIWERLEALWAATPDLVGGSNRLDSLITRVSGGKLLAKEGADGLLAVASAAGSSEGFCCVIKIAHGYSPDHAALVLWQILKNKNHQLREGAQLVLAKLDEICGDSLEEGVVFHSLLTC